MVKKKRTEQNYQKKTAKKKANEKAKKDERKQVRKHLDSMDRRKARHDKRRRRQHFDQGHAMPPVRTNVDAQCTISPIWDQCYETMF